MPRAALALSLLLALVGAPLVSPPSAAAQEPSPADAVARGDAAWERRAEGHDGGHAAAGPIGEAVAAYEEAARQRPEDLEARWKLLRALWFEGDFSASTDEAKRDVFDRGRKLGEESIDLLAKRVGGRDKLSKMEPAAVGKALAGIPEAAPIFFFTAVHWGLWGEAFGRFAAARQGVAGKVRDDSRIVIALDERYEKAAGHRVLGRLHARAPSIPFITGWIDRDTAVSELRKACELFPDEPYNRLFLAEALLDHFPKARAEALDLLRGILAATPEPDRAVEWARARQQAQELIQKSS